MQVLPYQKAFVLHTRPFKENQVIAELLVQDLGRIAVVGYKGGKKDSAKSALFQPFRMLQVQVKYSKGLHKLIAIEALSAPLCLSHHRLYCGFYLNELVCRLCQADAPYETLFNHYFTALKQLESLASVADQSLLKNAMELVLRRFEDMLLSMLGYELNFATTLDTDLNIESGLYYELFEGGFVHTNLAKRGLLGEELAEICELLRGDAQDALQSVADKRQRLTQTKLLLRASLHRHLGDKPLKSRELFSK